MAGAGSKSQIASQPTVRRSVRYNKIALWLIIPKRVNYCFPLDGTFHRNLAMALVLCTGEDSVLLETRRLILRQAGHTVVPAVNSEQVILACKQHPFDVAVIGQSVSPESKRLIASLIRKNCPSAKILELHQAHHGRTLADADSWLEVPAGIPQELAERVTEMAIKKTGKQPGM